MYVRAPVFNCECWVIAKTKGSDWMVCVCVGGMLMLAKPSFPVGTLGWDKCGDGNPLDTLGGGSVFDYPHRLAEDPALGYM